MISHFFTSRQLRRCLCFFLAFLTLAFALSPALFQPAEAVAVADDITLALGLLFTSWAGITFATNAGAQTAVSNLISSKPNVASSIAGLITKNLVTEGSKLLLTGDVKTAFRSVLPEIQDFFQVSSNVVSSGGGGQLVSSFVVGVPYSVPIYSSGDIYGFWESNSIPYVSGLSFSLVCHSGTSVTSTPVYSLSSICTHDDIADFVFYLYKRSNGRLIPFLSYTLLSGSGGDFNVLSLGSCDSMEVIFSSSDSVHYKQSKEIDGTSALEILAPAPDYVPNPDDSQEPSNPDGSIFSGLSLSALLALIQQFATNPDADPGLDPSKMMQELQEAMGNTDPDPEPDPDPDPDPDPTDPSTPDSGGNTGEAPDFNGMMLPGLKDFFPFCIPFDLKAMMDALCADPEAPKFTFATSFLGQVYTVDIDLSAWNDVAAVIRYMVVAIYIVALAVATRKFIKW